MSRAASCQSNLRAKTRTRTIQEGNNLSDARPEVEWTSKKQTRPHVGLQLNCASDLQANQTVSQLDGVKSKQSKDVKMKKEFVPQKTQIIPKSLLLFLLLLIQQLPFIRELPAAQAFEPSRRTMLLKPAEAFILGHQYQFNHLSQNQVHSGKQQRSDHLDICATPI